MNLNLSNNPPIPSHYLKEMLKLILQENSFQFIGNNYLQTHGTAMGTKMAVAFANIFMADIETKMISQSKTKPIEWKRFIDDIFSLWDSDKKEINLFIEQANNFHPTIKFTAEISDNETTFLDTIIFKGERFRNESILDIGTHNKPTEHRISVFGIICDDSCDDVIALYKIITNHNYASN